VTTLHGLDEPHAILDVADLLFAFKVAASTQVAVEPSLVLGRNRGCPVGRGTSVTTVRV
jgi:hypothetical protein